MAIVEVFTKARMFAIEQSAIVSARLESYVLILTKKDGTDLSLGNIRGATGLTPSLRGTSTTSHAISIASKTFAVSGLTVSFPVGQTVKVMGVAPENYMVGEVTASTTTSVTVNIREIDGTGTFASWTITPGAYTGTQGPPGIVPNLRALSVTSDTIALGSQAFAITGLTAPFPLDSVVLVSSGANPANHMVGYVTASSLSSVTVNVVEIGGSGTFADWRITPGGIKGNTGATGAIPTLRGTSTTSQPITIASKVFAVSGLNVAFPIGMTVKVIAAVATNYMVGEVTASSTTSITINVREVGGTGTFASWTIVPGAYRGQATSGTTAQRNALYPVPTTDAQRAALANALPVWFNTDLGWMESYYADTGLAGLTAPGLVTGSGAGWYPTGRGPMAVVYTYGGMGSGSAIPFTTWHTWGVGQEPGLQSRKNTPGNNNDGSSIFYKAVDNAALQTFLPGRYRVTCHMSYPAGSGNMGGALWVTQGSSNRRIYKNIPMQTGSQTEWYEFSDIVIGSGGYAWYRSEFGVGNVGGDAETHMALEYLGPPLVTR